MAPTRSIDWGTFRPAQQTLTVSHLDTFVSPIDGSPQTQRVDTTIELTDPANAAIAQQLEALQSAIVAKLSTQTVTATVATPPVVEPAPVDEPLESDTGIPAPAEDPNV